MRRSSSVSRSESRVGYATFVQKMIHIGNEYFGVWWEWKRSTDRRKIYDSMNTDK